MMLKQSSSNHQIDEPGTRNTLFYGIVVGFLVVMLLIAFSLWSSYRTLSSTENMVADIIDSSNKKQTLIYGMRQIARERVVMLHQILDIADSKARNKVIDTYYALARQFVADRRQLEVLAAFDEEAVIMARLKSALADVYPMQVRMLGALRNGDNKIAVEILDEVELKQQILSDILTQYSRLEDRLRRKSLDGIKNIFDESTQWMFFFSIVVLLSGSAVSFGVVRFVSRQQKKLLEMNDTLESYNQFLRLSAMEAERGNKIKMEFIANLSHELRTPMTTIKGSLGILNSGMIAHIPDEAKNLISMADQNTDQLLDLLNDVLDFSRLEKDEIDFVKYEFDIRREIENFLIPFYKKARNKSLNFQVVFSDKLPLKVKLDQKHLFQMLSQLLSNAIKFTDQGEVLLRVEYKEDTDHILFHIKDTGIGLDDKEIQCLFDSFVQGDGSSTRKYGGTGIGLAICKKLINALQGEITVSSVKQKGSTFSLSLPVDIAA